MAEEDFIKFDTPIQPKMPSAVEPKPLSPVSDTQKPTTHVELLSDLEEQTAILMHSWESWRELIVPIHSVLMWEKSYYPGAIIGATTFLYLCLWLLEPSVLTTLSIIGLTVTICDYFVPIVTATLFKPDMWCESKQKAYYELCNAVIIYKEKIKVSWGSFYVTRYTKPKCFYLYSIVNLIFFAWIGNTFNNLFLLYALTTSLLLLPGMERHGVVYKFGVMLRQKAIECTKLQSSYFKKNE